MSRAVSGYLLLLSVSPACLAAQSLEQRVSAVETGTVHLSFAARPCVCGERTTRPGNGDGSEDWEDDCETQPIRVALQLREHRVVGIRTYVGGRWRSGARATDLGTVRSQEAAPYFMNLAAGAGELSGDPILPATLADSVTIWPSLLRLARTSTLPEERRRTAVFWLGQAAGSAAGGALDSIAGDSLGNREIRKQAIFALSQRSNNEGVPILIRIARTSPDRELRRTALFWLGQSQDPRALDLFEEILR
jgi:HEAT repeat protein